MSKDRWIATYRKWIGNHPTDRWLTIAIIVALIIMFITALMLSNAEAHDIHFEDVVNDDNPVIKSLGWVEGEGFGMCTADGCWIVYKGGDLAHVCLHVKPYNLEGDKINDAK